MLLSLLLVFRGSSGKERPESRSKPRKKGIKKEIWPLRKFFKKKASGSKTVRILASGRMQDGRRSHLKLANI
jgi:hypothetical protein